MIKNKFIALFASVVFAASVTAGAAIAADTNTSGKTVVKQKLSDADRQSIKDSLKAIKALPKEQRKAKMDELKAKYPGWFNKMAMRSRARGMGKLMELSKTNPQLAADLKAMKALPADQKKAKMQELKKKYLKS